MNKNQGQTDGARYLSRIAGWYFAAQAILGLFWWIGIKFNPDFATHFFAIETANHDMQTFVFADVFWFVAMSGVTAILIWRGSEFMPYLLWTLVGAIGYAFFCCLGLTFDGGKWLSVGLMAGSWAGTLFFAIQFRKIEPTKA